MPIHLVRVALRTLARRPALTVVAIVSLAVGIGVNSAVFSIVDALFLRPPAVRDPYGLVNVQASYKDSGIGVLDWSDCEGIAQQPAFSAATAYMRRGGMWRHGDEATMLMVTVVADNYFDLLGVKPAMGRLPGPNYRNDPEPPVYLAHWFWREKMGAQADVVGQTINLSSNLYRIAGVLPPEFRGVEPMGTRHVWIPVGSWTRYMARDLQRGSGQFEALARLHPGATMAQAQAQLDSLAKQIEESDSKVPRGRRLQATSMGTDMQSRVQPGLLVLAVVALVLLIACANVATALLAAADGRRREIGVRLAMGAGRWALMRQFLAESAVLACAGMAAGLLLARWLLSLAPTLAPPTSVPISFDLRMDARLFMFTSAAALLTLVIFGAAPFVYAVRVSLLEALGGARVAGARTRSFSRVGFVAAQVALCVVLVTGAVALAFELADTRTAYMGYDSSRPLALIWAHNEKRGPTDAELYRQAAERMAAIGGVEAVTYARHLPLVGSGAGASLAAVPEGAAPDSTPHQIYFNLVGPKFFEVTGARLEHGRSFTAADHDASGAPVAIVNAEAARRFWPGQDAVGKTLRVKADVCQVVGVASDAPKSGVHEPAEPAVYLPVARIDWGETIFIARTKSDPAALLKPLSKAVKATGDLGSYEALTLRSLMTQALYGDWIWTVLGGGLAVVGLLLAAGGLYGAVWYATQRRAREFGVRIAIGARATQIGGLVLRYALAVCAAGVPAGIAAALWMYRHYGPTLFQDRPLDPAALIAGTAITVATVLAGAIVPAIRASCVDPVEVLRAE